MDEKRMLEVIRTILNNGNTAEVKKRKEDIIVIENTRKVKTSVSLSVEK